MKILAVGGGSGGHVTPVVAVLKELRALHPKVELKFGAMTHLAHKRSLLWGRLTIPFLLKQFFSENYAAITI